MMSRTVRNPPMNAESASTGAVSLVAGGSKAMGLNKGTSAQPVASAAFRSWHSFDPSGVFRWCIGHRPSAPWAQVHASSLAEPHANATGATVSVAI
jgi:hypothetical protein